MVPRRALSCVLRDTEAATGTSRRRCRSAGRPARAPAGPARAPARGGRRRRRRRGRRRSAATVARAAAATEEPGRGRAGAPGGVPGAVGGAGAPGAAGAGGAPPGRRGRSDGGGAAAARERRAPGAAAERGGDDRPRAVPAPRASVPVLASTRSCSPAPVTSAPSGPSSPPPPATTTIAAAATSAPPHAASRATRDPAAPHTRRMVGAAGPKRPRSPTPRPVPRRKSVRFGGRSCAFARPGRLRPVQAYRSGGATGGAQPLAPQLRGVGDGAGVPRRRAVRGGHRAARPRPDRRPGVRPRGRDGGDPRARQLRAAGARGGRRLAPRTSPRSTASSPRRAAREPLLDARVWAADGTILYARDRRQIGRRPHRPAPVADALRRRDRERRPRARRSDRRADRPARRRRARRARSS